MKKLILLVALLTFGLFSYAQRTITGAINSGDNQPIGGVKVVSMPSGQQTLSNADGSFTLVVGANDSRLVFDSNAYTINEVALKPQRDRYLVLASAIRLDDVVVVGSRSAGRSRLSSLAPVDVFSISKYQQQVPQSDVNQVLQYLSPSFNSNRQSSSDGTEHIDPASIRGLGPDQLLVLLNGKRRHTTSLVNNQGTIGNGSVGTDLNTIPLAAIDHIEVLRDGASAQYGSDAIAGVINVVLKKNTNQLWASANSGISSRNDGGLLQLDLNYGTALGKNGGYLNLTGGAYTRGTTNRTQNHDLIIFDQSALGNYFAYPFLNDPAASRAYDDAQLAQKGLKRDDFNFHIGDAKINNYTAFYNLSLPFGNKKGEFYSFGGYNYRNGVGYGFRRLPSDPKVNVYSIFPDGYQPETLTDIHDRSIAIGTKYEFGAWHADLSNTLGDNRFDYTVDNTVNASLGSASATRFKAGGHEFLQNTTNLDFNRKFPTVASGLNLGLGAEFRIDQYRIRSGEEAAWKNYKITIDPAGQPLDLSGYGVQGGSQSFVGFSPNNEINRTRNNVGIYTDVELNVSKKWLLNAAARFEHYSDFGSTFNEKFATLYKISPTVNVRGSFSTGYRAPSLHQQYFNYSSTDILPDNTIGQAGIFTNDSKVAKALNIPTLKQETSTNFSGGFTIRASKDINLSIDAYQTDISNRIVLSGQFGYDVQGTGGGVAIPAIQAIINPYGANSARFFSNAIDTKSKGMDVVIDYNKKINNNNFGASLGFNLNETEITAIHIPEQLKGQERIFFSPKDSILITRGNPRMKTTLQLRYEIGKINLMLNNVYFGRVSRYEFPFGEIQTFDGRVVTDLSVGYTLKPVTFTIGANNVFDVFADTQAYANSYFGVFKYAPVQMGTLGRFYFARITLALPNKTK